MLPPREKTTYLPLLASLLALGGCAGQSFDLPGLGAGKNEGGSSGSATNTPEGSKVATPSDGSADDFSGRAADGSTRMPVNALDTSVSEASAESGATAPSEAGPEGSLPTGAADANSGEGDIGTGCGPATGGTYFVDPNTGRDDDGATGSRSCPFESLTHALSIVGDAGAAVTVEIVNVGMAAPTLDESTGEVFPIIVPGGVTITAEDTTKNTPTVEPGLTQNVPIASPCTMGTTPAFCLPYEHARLSHVVVDDSNAPTGLTYGIVVASPGVVVIDHVTVENFSAGGIYVPPTEGAPGPTPTIGPGVVALRDGVAGLRVDSNAMVTIMGGAGNDHTSFTQNGYGIWVAGGAVNVRGTAISASNPDVSDIDADRNSRIGLRFEGALPPIVSTVLGLHIVGAQQYGILASGSLTLRDSFVGNNQMGVDVEGGNFDLGNPVGRDYGRNIFVGNAAGDICGSSARQPVLAAGNIFGTVDCALGGKLDPSVTCGDTTDVNVSNCTF
jgi:hypothetical protein